MFEPLFRSHLGRRLLLRFLLAALLPMGGMAVFAYFQVGNMLVDLNYRRLQQDSRALGMSFIEAFNWRAQALKREARRLSPSGGRQDGDQQTSPRLEGFARVDIQPPAPSLSAEEARHLDHNGVLLRLSGDQAAVMLTRLADGRLLRGQIAPDSLWRDEEAPEHYCVVGTDFLPLYCTPALRPPSAETWPALMARRNAGVFDWRVWEGHGEEPHLVAFWRASLRPGFAHGGFIVMVADSRREVLKGLDRFRQVFPALFVAALSLGALLAISQIRRQIKPLEQLSEGTRRLADGDFGGAVRVSGDDEFAALAGAFNHMSEKLRGKFQLLELLSRLDRAILGAAEMEQLARTVIEHLRDAVPCDRAGLLRIHAGGQVDFLATPTPEPEAAYPGCPGIWECLDPDRDQPWLRIDLASPRAGCLRQLFQEPMREVLTFPSRTGERLETLLLLAYARVPEEIEEILAAGRGIADRLAVAASNLAWEEKLYHQAHYDALTDLPNRALLRDRVEQALSRADREHALAAVMLLDLDNFKQVNDTLGHSAGDALLIECAKRLRARVRQSDTVARLGGDEFIILLPDLPRGTETATLDALARKLNHCLAEPMIIAGRQITTPASIGIAIYPDNAGNHEDLLKMADAAMYESKRQRRGGFRFYSAEMNAQANARFELTQDLRDAIAGDELTLYYQPKIELASGRMVGAEALVRWLSPKRGVVPPDRKSVV